MFKTLIVGTREAVLTSTHNLCFGSTITKRCKPVYPSCLGGIHYTHMFFVNSARRYITWASFRNEFLCPMLPMKFNGHVFNFAFPLL